MNILPHRRRIHAALFAVSAAILFSLCGCQKPERALGEDHFSNGLVMWGVGSNYRETHYIARPISEPDLKEDYPLPRVYLKFEDGAVAFLPEMKPEFLAKRKGVIYDPDDGAAGDNYSFMPTEFYFKGSKISTFHIMSRVSLGPTADGPFVKLPCPADEFVKVFGDPVNETDIKPHR